MNKDSRKINVITQYTVTLIQVTPTGMLFI